MDLCLLTVLALIRANADYSILTSFRGEGSNAVLISSKTYTFDNHNRPRYQQHISFCSVVYEYS